MRVVYVRSHAAPSPPSLHGLCLSQPIISLVARLRIDRRLDACGRLGIGRLPRQIAPGRAKGASMFLFDALAWGFVGFTALLCLGILYLWWQERQTERP